MVDPISPTERAQFYRRVKAGMTLLVGASAGLITLQVTTSAAETAGAVAAGLVVGYALAWFIVPSGSALADRDRPNGRSPERENPFADGSGGRAGDGGDRDEDRQRR